ncbi:MAG: hypothetical protein LUH21_22000 [Clostridiales bacterium]|nr:hypothetical protein [Clostridiales bacterium]
MNTKTSLAADHVRLQQWIQQIQDCKNRPGDMSVNACCCQQSIIKANYYYRLKRVREAYLNIVKSNGTAFVEPPSPASVPAT